MPLMRGTRLPFEPASLPRRKRPDCRWRYREVARPASTYASVRGPISDFAPDTANSRLPTVELVLCLNTSQFMPTVAYEGNDKECLPL